MYISTSSAGGGLQMMVGGVVKNMTGESAERAALGAGAIVMDILASNDGRLYHEKVKRIRELRPDMLLLSGGVDGGTITHVMQLAEIIKTSNPKPRLGSNYKLPVIYAGNIKAQDEIKQALDSICDLIMVENIRPTLEKENLQPSRDKIHDLFMEHVMAQAPGYDKLLKWTHVPIMPTPGAVGKIIKTIANNDNISVVGVDIGGATTDVFSVFDGEFNRTVSANLGMSYSICNVLAESGIENIKRWVSFNIDEFNLTNRIANKMIRPTTIPQTLEELKIEHALAREALRLSFEQHKNFAVSLKGVKKERTISDTFDQQSSGETLVDMMKLDLIVGSGGVLSHAPKRMQSMRMLIDSFLPEGITQIAVDSIFMMPQLGVLSTVHEQAAIEVFHRDCLIILGSCIAPKVKNIKDKQLLFKYEIFNKNKDIKGELFESDFIYLKLNLEEYKIKIFPSKNVDVGNGYGVELDSVVKGGEVGIILDGRGRPLVFKNNDDRKKQIENWSTITKEYV